MRAVSFTRRREDGRLAEPIGGDRVPKIGTSTAAVDRLGRRVVFLDIAMPGMDGYEVRDGCAGCPAWRRRF